MKKQSIKKLSGVIVLLMCMGSCTISVGKKVTPEKIITDPYNTVVDASWDAQWKTVTFDSCEYIAHLHYGTTILTHKGNCSHCRNTHK